MRTALKEQRREILDELYQARSELESEIETLTLVREKLDLYINSLHEAALLDEDEP